MPKFHIKSNGEPAICKAEKNCPLGTGTPHAEFENAEDARAWVEKINANAAGGSFTPGPKLLKSWVYNSYISANGQDKTPDGEALLFEKIANAEDENEVHNAAMEIKNLVFRNEPNYELATRLLESIQKQEIMDVLGTEFSLYAFDRLDSPESTEFLKMAYNHPLSNDEIRSRVMRSSALTYEEKQELIGDKNDFSGQVALLSSTDWVDEGFRRQRETLANAVNNIESSSGKGLSMYHAHALIKASDKTKFELPPNVVFGHLKYDPADFGHYHHAPELIEFGMKNMKELSKENRATLVDLARHSSFVYGERINTIGNMQRSAQIASGGLPVPEVVYDRDTRDSLKSKYDEAFSKINSTFRKDFISEDQTAAYAAQAEYDKTRIPELSANLENYKNAANRRFSPSAVRQEARAEARKTGDRLAYAVEALEWDKLENYLQSF